MLDNLSITVHTFARCMLPSLSVDEILLPRHVHLSTNFRGLPLKVAMASFCFKHRNAVFVSVHVDYITCCCMKFYIKINALTVPH